MAAPESLWSRFIVCPNSGRRNRKVDIARIVVATYGYALGVAGSLLARMAGDGPKEQSMLTFYRLVRKTT